MGAAHLGDLAHPPVLVVGDADVGPGGIVVEAGPAGRALPLLPPVVGIGRFDLDAHVHHVRHREASVLDVAQEQVQRQEDVPAPIEERRSPEVPRQSQKPAEGVDTRDAVVVEVRPDDAGHVVAVIAGHALVGAQEREESARLHDLES